MGGVPPMSGELPPPPVYIPVTAGGGPGHSPANKEQIRFAGSARDEHERIEKDIRAGTKGYAADVELRKTRGSTTRGKFSFSDSSHPSLEDSNRRRLCTLDRLLQEIRKVEC